ncbi:MAG: NAD(P)/FAD-dependent oxidoreductase [Rhizonema sp. PD37]|nr:NAD(P)/FAD-dependent oxidoreductase [Rhizonema sp. PD37]
MLIYDIIIVGAGPIGLATAIGLRKLGIENLLVIDQARTFRQVGQVVDLLPNGLKALKSLDFQAYEEVKKTGLEFFNQGQSSGEKTKTIQEQKPSKASSEWVTRNLQGQRISAISLKYDDWFKDYGEGRVPIPWYDLQTTLRNQLPQNQVKANHRCINIVDEPENGCVRIDCLSNIEAEANPYAYWADGQKGNDTQPQNSDTAPQEKSLRAKLVVAADGINSTVRRVLYANSQYHAFAKPEYSGFTAVSCMEITEIPNELETELEEKFFQGSRILTISNDEISNSTYKSNQRMMLFLRNNLGYILHLALPLNSLQGKAGNALVDLALQELEKADFPDVLQQLVRKSPPDNMLQRPYYIHHATVSDSVQHPGVIPPAWSQGRIVLVGDAAHGMPPFMAQGANQGFEDALLIARLIANIAQKNNWDDMQAIAKAFEKYESLRRPLIAYVQQATLTRSPLSSDEKRLDYNQQIYCRNFEQVMEALL